MQDRSAAVVDLASYRQRRTPESSHSKEKSSDTQHVIAELAYHLLKAIQAVKKLPH